MKRIRIPVILALLALPMLSAAAVACPFCAATSQTLSEELASTDIAAICQLIEPAPLPEEDSANDLDPNAGNAKFRVVEVLNGSDFLSAGDEISVVYFGEDDRDKRFLINGLAGGGVTGEEIDWTIPLPLSLRAVDYIKLLDTVPETGADRLAFFQQYFEDEDPLLAQDAYEEFARMPYSDVIALRDRMEREKLVAWINDPQVGATRRRLYLTMLGVCGQPEDVQMLAKLLEYDYRQLQPGVEAMVSLASSLGMPVGLTLTDELLRADQRRKKQCLDALVAAYLKLRGPEGLDLVDRLFLTNPNAEYTHLYSTIMALRFHGEESDDIPRERLLRSMRLLLNNEEVADQVIPDLARWEDWSILPRLMEMFKSSEEDAWVRQPIISFVITAEEQEGEVGQQASDALGELEALDPAAVKRARTYMAYALLPRGNPQRSESPESGGEAPTAESTETTDDADSHDASAAETPVENETPAADDSSGTAAIAEEPPSKPAPSSLLIIGIPIVAVVLLMGVFAVLLRGVDSGAGEQKKTDAT